MFLRLVLKLQSLPLVSTVLRHIPIKLKQSLFRTYASLHQLFSRRVPSRPVFVVSSPRSGSTLLISYLKSIKQWQFVGEILNQSEPFGLPAGIREKKETVSPF